MPKEDRKVWFGLQLLLSWCEQHQYWLFHLQLTNWEVRRRGFSNH